MDPGTSMTWTERRAVTLRLGNPGAVTLTVDGRTRAGLGPDPATLRLAPGQRSSGVAPAPATPAGCPGMRAVWDFAAAMERVNQSRPQASSWNGARVYQAGIGPFGKDEAVAKTLNEMQAIDPWYLI